MAMQTQTREESLAVAVFDGTGAALVHPDPIPCQSWNDKTKRQDQTVSAQTGSAAFRYLSWVE